MGSRAGLAADLARNMTEPALDAQIQEAARKLGLLCYHTWISVRSKPGFPDLVIAGRHGHIFRELKSEVGKITPAQQRWLDTLNTPGWTPLDRAGVWRPRDWYSGTIGKELVYLSYGKPP